jgi:integrase
VYLTAEVAALLREQLACVDAFQKATGRITPHVFVHRSGAYRGRRIVAFDKAWATACRRASAAGRLVHDLRRTAVRNMERSGVPRSWVTKMTGHQTESVYRRYANVSDDDLREAARRLETGAFRGAFSHSGE